MSLARSHQPAVSARSQISSKYSAFPNEGAVWRRFNISGKKVTGGVTRPVTYSVNPRHQRQIVKSSNHLRQVVGAVPVLRTWTAPPGEPSAPAHSSLISNSRLTAMRKVAKTRPGLTLIEILIVMAVAALLMNVAATTRSALFAERSRTLDVLAKPVSNPLRKAT